MRKIDLVRLVAAENGFCVSRADEIVQAVLGQVAEVLAEKGRLSLRHFGVFRVREKAERKGRNPKTGEIAKIRARRVVQFKASKNWKNKINGRGEK